MNEKELCDALAEACICEHATTGMTSGPLLGRLSEVFQKLRGLNIPWSKILALVGPIIQLLLTGGDFSAVLQAILALFFPPHQCPKV